MSWEEYKETLKKEQKRLREVLVGRTIMDLLLFENGESIEIILNDNYIIYTNYKAGIFQRTQIREKSVAGKRVVDEL